MRASLTCTSSVNKQYMLDNLPPQPAPTEHDEKYALEVEEQGNTSASSALLWQTTSVKKKLMRLAVAYQSVLAGLFVLLFTLIGIIYLKKHEGWEALTTIYVVT